jgi:peptide/nickel transport system ATP-binding protein
MSSPEAASSVPRLQVRDLNTTLVQSDGVMPLVRGVSFDLHAGQTLALVGESGSGKSLTALSIMRLLARNARWQCGGQALFTDASGQTRDVLQLSETEMRQLRGHQMAMIFQEPMTCLNPVLTVGEQIAESVRLHWGLNKRDARQRALHALQQVEIPAAGQRMDEYPHQLSGGMRQRVMIAMAMVCEPQVLIADEPTTALDVTIQAQILSLMSRLQRDTGMSMLFITHNLGVVAHHAERVAVMYAGQVVEQANVHALFAQPAHPYTQGLLACLPGRARQLSLQEGRRMALQDIPGQAPDMGCLGAGCSFTERCASRLSICSLQAPIWQGDAAHARACHLEQPS